MSKTVYNGKDILNKDVLRFWARVDVRGADECWPWQAGRNGSKYGYGIFWVNGRGELSHRIALALSGIDPGKLFVCHKCDNPSCCNPRHLYAGTNADNMRDKMERGRAPALRGILHPLAKLDDVKVRKIRRLHRLREKYKKYTKAYLARKYGVDPGLIAGVIRGTSWKHIGG